MKKRTAPVRQCACQLGAQLGDVGVIVRDRAAEIGPGDAVVFGHRHGRAVNDATVISFLK